jgi:hypothetical protein
VIALPDCINIELDVQRAIERWENEGGRSIYAYFTNALECETDHARSSGEATTAVPAPPHRPRRESARCSKCVGDHRAEADVSHCGEGALRPPQVAPSQPADPQHGQVSGARGQYLL